jgi:plasmid stabilization system protein ParE
MIYRFLSPALEEVRDAAVFYGGRVSGLGADFLDELDSAIERILQFPEAWGRLGDDHRRCNLRRFPYSIIYQIQPAQEIVIISVFHQSRESQSWLENL